METGRVSLDIILIGAAAGIMVGIMSISGLAFSMTIQLMALAGGNVFLLLLLIAVLTFVLGIGLADGERLHPDRDAARAGAGQARRHADGRAHVRHVQRHAVDDHAAGGDRRLRRGQYRAHRRLDHRLDRLRGRLEHVLPAVPVRTDAEPADGRQLDRDRPRISAASPSASGSAPRRRSASRSRRSNVAGRALYAVISLAVVLPPEAFPGAIWINAAGITAAVIDARHRLRQRCGTQRKERPPSRGDAVAERRQFAFAPDAERFLRRPVGNREQHGVLAADVVRIALPWRHHEHVVDAPFDRLAVDGGGALAFRHREHGAVGRAVGLALEALAAAARGWRPWSAAPARH